MGIYFALMGSASELLYTLEWSFMVGLGFCGGDLLFWGVCTVNRIGQCDGFQSKPFAKWRVK